MKIGLRSFFIDCYDHWFASRYEADEIWYRRGDLPPDKIMAFRLFDQKGILTPQHGTAEYLRKHFGPDTEVVAYYDPTAHASHGKYKTKLKNVYYENMYCSLFIQTTEERPKSTRIMWVGDRCFQYKLSSNHEWMSNTGTDYEITDACELFGQVRHFQYPLYAIDYVKEYAVDLNRCPAVRGTGIESLITSKECAEEIIQYAHRFDFDGNPR